MHPFSSIVEGHRSTPPPNCGTLGTRPPSCEQTLRHWPELLPLGKRPSAPGVRSRSPGASLSIYPFGRLTDLRSAAGSYFSGKLSAEPDADTRSEECFGVVLGLRSHQRGRIPRTVFARRPFACRPVPCRFYLAAAAQETGWPNGRSWGRRWLEAFRTSASARRYMRCWKAGWTAREFRRCKLIPKMIDHIKDLLHVDDGSGNT